MVLSMIRYGIAVVRPHAGPTHHSYPHTLPDCVASQFVEPMVAMSSSKGCAAELITLASSGESFGAAQPGCYRGLEDALISTVLIAAVSAVKVSLPPHPPVRAGDNADSVSHSLSTNSCRKSGKC